MQNSIHFRINGNHESHTGSADIIESASEIKELYAQQFNIYSHLVTVRRIGTVEVDAINYEIYESYYDSGSDDYMYFAVII